MPKLRKPNQTKRKPNSLATNLPLIRHLSELRSRLLIVFAIWLLLFVICAIYSRQLYGLIADPLIRLLPTDGSLIAIEVASPVLVPLKLAAFASFVLALPVVLHQLWSFISPGLYRKEKLIALPLLFSSVLLFYLGMAFVYYLVLPLVLQFFHRIAPEDVQLMTDMRKYLNFVLRFLIVFALIFELPIALFLVVRGGLVSLARLKSARRYVIVGCFVIAMLLTPPDIFSQLLLAVPMVVLYEVGLLLIWVDQKFWRRR